MGKFLWESREKGLPCWLSIGSLADALLKNYFLNLVNFELGLTVRSKTSLILLVSYLVDPASSHMLVSKIKPCMSKYKPH